MTEMVERVARAMFMARRAQDIAYREAQARDPMHGACGCMGPLPYCRCQQRDEEEIARAAIAAMAEPTEAMRQAYRRDVTYDEMTQTFWPTLSGGADGNYRAMIKAALGE